MSRWNEQHLGKVETSFPAEGFTWRRSTAEERLIRDMRTNDTNGTFRRKSDDYIISVARLWIGINSVK